MFTAPFGGDPSLMVEADDFICSSTLSP